MSSFTYCNTGHRCGICGSAKDCRISHEGLHFCKNRHTGDYSPGFVHVGETQNDVWGMWREDLYADPETRSRRPVASSTPARPARDPEAEARARKRAAFNFASGRDKTRTLDARDARKLSESLGLPADLLQAHWRCFGETALGQDFVLPEYGFGREGDFRVVCYLWRSLDGKKLNYGDPEVPCKRGLTLLEGWDQNPGSILVPEGASDTLALQAMGLCAIGRPSSRAGVEVLAQYLAQRPDLADRMIVILGENDQKPNGRWEGRDGAEAFAQKLANQLGRPVRLAMPPAGAKDVRDWFGARWKPGVNPRSLAPEFTRAVMEYRRIFQPRITDPTVPVTPQQRFVSDLERVREFTLAILHDCRADAQEQEQIRAKVRDNVARAVAQARARQECYRCPHCYPILMRGRQSRIPHLAWLRCQKWFCPGCKNWMILREHGSASYHFHAAAELYEFGCTEEQWQAMHKRIRRAQGNYHRTRDGDGWYVVTDVFVEGLDGRNPVLVTPEHALSTVDTLLAVWQGDFRPVTTSRGWKLLRENNEMDLEVLGICDPSLDNRQIGEIARQFDAEPRPVQSRASDRPSQVLRLWRFDRPGGWDEPTTREFAQALFDGQVFPRGLKIVHEDDLVFTITTIADDLALN